MRKIEFVDICKLKVNVNTILNTFYTHSLMLHAANSQTTTRMQKAVDRYISDLHKFFDETIEKYAQVLFWYLVVICGGEVRYIQHRNTLGRWWRIIFNKLILFKSLSNKKHRTELSDIIKSGKGREEGKRKQEGKRREGEGEKKKRKIIQGTLGEE